MTSQPHVSASNLLGIPPTLLPDDSDLRDALARGESPTEVAASAPQMSLPWAVLAEQALDDSREVEAYAYARVGYHRGLDALRRAGWRGQGPVPWTHEPNRGFLRALAALARAAREIGETSEYERCAQFLRDSDPQAGDLLG